MLPASLQAIYFTSPRAQRALELYKSSSHEARSYHDYKLLYITIISITSGLHGPASAKSARKYSRNLTGIK